MPHPLVKILVASVLAAPLSACLTDPAELADEDLATVESSLCLIPPTPPPYSTLWYLPDVGYRNEQFSYGTGECSAKVLAARNTRYVGAGVSGLVTEAACTGTTLNARVYLKIAGTWALVYTDSIPGFWWPSLGGCYLPSLGAWVESNQEVRIHASAKRTTCAGAICGTTYGVPVTIDARGEGS